MSDLRREVATLQPPISNLADLMAVARALRRATAAHYRELAESMRRHGNDVTAATFERIAAQEDERGRMAGAPAGTGIGAATSSTLDRWARAVLGDGRGVEDAHLATPYTALAVVVRDAERLFSAFSYLAASAESPEVKKAAERLADEELGRGARLRVERRRAYHEERREEEPRHWPSPWAVRSLPDLLAAARTVERNTATRLCLAPARDPILSHLCDETLRLADRLDREADAAAAPGPRMKEALEEIAGGGVSPVPEGAFMALREALADAERAFAFYDAVESSAKDENAMQRAQDLTENALRRVKLLYERLDQFVNEAGRGR